MASKKKDVGRVASLRYWQAEDARAVVEAWQESGERLSALARRHGIKLSVLKVQVHSEGFLLRTFPHLWLSFSTLSPPLVA